MRKGFGGNYRRASESFAVPRMKPSSASGSSDARLLDSSSSLKSSSSFCHKNRNDELDHLPSSTSSSCIFMTASTDNPQQSKNIRLSDIPRDAISTAENLLERNGETLVTGHVTGALPSTRSQIQGEGDGSDGDNPQIPMSGKQGLLLQLTEDEGSSVSVKECVKSLERTGAVCPTMEEKSKPASKSRVAELRETILRRSSENLATDAGCNDPPRVNKRPVSAFFESSSIGTFPKIPISLIQRRSIGSLLKPSLTSVQQRPHSTILNPVFEPKSTADKMESDRIDGPSQNNPSRRRSFKNFSSLGRKGVEGNVWSLQLKSNLETGNKVKNETDATCDIRVSSGADMVVGSLIKTDSSDSGIDTKTDCLGNKSSPGGVEGVPVGQFQTTTGLDKLCRSPGQFSTETFSRIQGNDSVSPEECSGLNELGNVQSESAPKKDSFNLSTTVIFVDLESEELAKLSSEEVLFDELAVRFLSRMGDCESDLHSVLITPDFHRTPFYYMADLIRGIKIPEFWVKLPTVNIPAECETSDRSLEDDQVTCVFNLDL